MSSTRSARTGLKAAVAAAGAVGLLTTGVAFAASGHAPWSNATAGAAATHAADPTHPTHPTHATGGPSDDSSESTGPNAHAFGGLCRAYTSGNKTEHGKALESPAFTALVTAAGGVENVEAFCATVSSSHPTHPAHPTQSGAPSDHPSGAAHPSPTHPMRPTQGAEPTHPTEATLPAHATEAPTPTHPAP